MTDSTTISDQLVRLARATEWIHARWRRELGISAYELLALLHLQAGSMTVGDLGSRLALTSGAMTGLIDRLEDTGLVSRERSTEDRRRVLVAVTQRTRDRLETLQAQLADDVEQDLASRAVADIDCASSVLDVIIGVHERQAEGDG